mmetsp:Transcript_13302/g.30319  ORF Transcript_13302/g.30319 Transcript_13302/m.30319 type:complete len:95 (-) Transcript_13302:3130-3414(-)
MQQSVLASAKMAAQRAVPLKANKSELLLRNQAANQNNEDPDIDVIDLELKCSLLARDDRSATIGGPPSEQKEPDRSVKNDPSAGNRLLARKLSK